MKKGFTKYEASVLCGSKDFLPPPPYGSSVTPQRAHLWEERAAQASPGLLIPALRPDTHPPSSSPDTSAFIFFSPSASPGEKGKSHLAAKKSWMRREKENKFLAVSDKRSWRWENGLKVAYNF